MVNNDALVILAAGASTRMNDVKQLLPWKSSTLLGNAIEQALKSESRFVYVVLGANFELIKKEIEKYPVTILKNKNWKSGMGSSISCAFKYFLENNLTFNGALISLADQPFITYTYLNKLIKCYSENDSKYIVSTKYLNKGGVPAIFPPRCFNQLSNLTKEFGAKEILNSSVDTIYTINNKASLFDIDTEDDFNKASILN